MREWRFLFTIPGDYVVNWNPWHGCRKISAGCDNCYVYRIDGRHNRDASAVTRTKAFAAPVARNRSGAYKIPPGEEVWTCFTSDFLLPLADEWRQDCWDMIRERQDLSFTFITKRIDRFAAALPPDWGEGWPNVTVGCTVENQDRADFRLPLFLGAPIRSRFITLSPMLEDIDISPWLDRGKIRMVSVSGESGSGAREFRFEWALTARERCVRAGIPFWFMQTGANFVYNGKICHIPRRHQHSQARKAGIDYLRGEGLDETV